jgi:uracil phosphoribosyltransferase
MKNLRILDHPVLSARMTLLRDEKAGTEVFARMADLAGKILAVESTRYLESVACEVRTPLEKTEGSGLRREICLVPVLRAGLALLEPFRDLLPEACVAISGLHGMRKHFRPIFMWNAFLKI